MKSFAFMGEANSAVLIFTIYTEIKGLEKYFRFMCRDKADEAMQLSLLHALVHFDECSGDLKAYLKALARTILKDRFYNKETPFEYIADVVPSQPENTVEDISISVISSILEEGCHEEVVKLALTCMPYFVSMCEALITRNASTLYFPDYYTESCSKLQAEYKTFIPECLNLYHMYKKEFKKFLSYPSDPSWSEARFVSNKDKTSTRVVLLDDLTGEPATDPDTQTCIVRGGIKDKIIIKVPYTRWWNYMCSLIDEDGINSMKFTIDEHYIVRTFSDSWSILDPSLFSLYDLCEAELITNILRDTNGRLLCKGSRCLYIIVSKMPNFPYRRLRGELISFKAEVAKEVLRNETRDV